MRAKNNEGKDAEVYRALLETPSGKNWERLGLARRSGVVAPLFSVYSADSVGIGELADLDRLADWCRATGMSLLQLLPMNDVGFDFQPYSAQSSFALEPMYLSFKRLTGVRLSPFLEDIAALKGRFPTGPGRVNYGIKGAKLGLLWEIFRVSHRKGLASFEKFVEQNRFWLHDYAVFKTLKEVFGQSGWESWEEPFRRKDPAALERFAQEHEQQIEFQQWLQWQLYEQFRAAKRYARKQGVFLIGDIPFLVSRDSADVWANQSYFKLHLASGAPPDMFFATGQRWGMPPYDWSRIEEHRYDYVVEKLRYAEHFFDFYRIDHVVGIFRVWTIPLSEPAETGGLNGVFDPKDENEWEEHGRTLLRVMIDNTRMIPCAEDLGVVPKCSNKVLEELGIPGMDVQRWTRDYEKTFDFKAPEAYRSVALATVGTHDTSSLRGWWGFEAGTIDEMLFRRKCASRNISYDEVRDRLFDMSRAAHGRLRWRPEVTDAETLLRIIDRREEEARDFISLYKEACDEKERFLAFVGLDRPADSPGDAAFVRAALQKAGDSIA
ncbi:MAG TPA: 4-alpha-glucanotransferase, partial [Elusimicrobiota bacterium]|nr:4-alpha-glucanotransferase [Elusimicrobiota bacterium]